MDKGTLSFDVKTGMKNIIGRDLITDDFIAIYELVKNSYDAYATHVIITFNKDEIIIADDGKGMSKKDLKDKWFAVAYSAKKDGTEDEEDKQTSHLDNLKSRRFYAGAKGVGRFSCDRLGNYLELTTTKVDSEISYKVKVDWKKFDSDAKESFGSIQIPFEEIKNDKIFPEKADNGTVLKITGLTSQWKELKLIELRRSLEKLINPFSSHKFFKIEIKAYEFEESDLSKPSFKKINGIISNSILKVLDLKTTIIDIQLLDEKITTKIIDRGTLIYHIQEKNKYQNIIDNLEINLYFLNRSAKINFGKLMDIEPVNYGNIFLYKNGFRVQPYGNVGDDSWEIDNRKQQGYNRFLGTRDLFGKVELYTENFTEFKEVSSRDGGLVETFGKQRLFEIFYEKALKRLERYVAGVLWGEGFKRRHYFFDESIAEQVRSGLKDDKDKDTYEDALKNIGSKIDFVNLIKTLSDDKQITIIEYNKDLVNLVNDQLDVVQPKFLAELEKIAEKTNDKTLLSQVKLTEENFEKILKEKEEAEKREVEERKKRIEAEKRADEEEKKRVEAENKRKIEEEKRRLAELQAAKKESERYKAELQKLKAEQKAKEEEERRKLEEQKNKDLEDKLGLETQKNQYLNATRKTLSDDAEQLIHSIDLYVGNAANFLNDLFNNYSDADLTILESLYSIKSNIDKALKVSSIIIKSNFDYKNVKQRVNLPLYIKEYLEDIQVSRGGRLEINIDLNVEFYSFLSTIDIDIILDNLISNSIKANTTKVFVKFSQDVNKRLLVDFYDNGTGVGVRFLKNPNSIFELGTRDSKNKGSGIGMYDIKKRLSAMKGSIKLVGNHQILGGAHFQLTFK